MSSERDSREPRPTLIAASYFAPDHIAFFEAWFEAACDALVRATAQDALRGWGIGVAAGSEAPFFEPPEMARFTNLALYAGGRVDWIHVGSDENTDDAVRHLASSAREDLLLFLDPRTIIPASAVVRMVSGYAEGFGSVSAGHIPLDSADENSAGRAAVLSARQGWADGRADIATATVRPEAIVFRDTQRALVSEVPEYAGQALIEEALVPEALAPARAVVARLFANADDLLLSVVVRTQGKRPEALRAALLCLAGQHDRRFELILVVHDADEDAVTAVLSDMPQWLARQTRVLSASGGGRSRPLNVGITGASGTHVAFLDDDDVVFAEWVGSFLSAAAQQPNVLLRARSGVQRVRTVRSSEGIEGHVAEPEMSQPYPERFDLADHLRLNMTPFMALAFPRSFFTLFGGADENLEVCEDWDLLLRAAIVLGVTDVPVLTAIYRRWTTGGDSYSVHAGTIWNRDMRRVREKLDAQVVLLPPGSASMLVGLSELRLVPAELAAIQASSSWRITRPLRAVVGALSRWRYKRQQQSLS